MGPAAVGVITAIALALAACDDLRVAPPPGGAAECRAAGFEWFGDVIAPYPPGPYSAPSHDCFCALPCKSDDDCDGVTLPHCSAIMVFGASDNAHCSSFRVCTATPARNESHCPEPPSRRTCE